MSEDEIALRIYGHKELKPVFGITLGRKQLRRLAKDEPLLRTVRLSANRVGHPGEWLLAYRRKLMEQK